MSNDFVIEIILEMNQLTLVLTSTFSPLANTFRSTSMFPLVAAKWIALMPLCN